MSAGNNNNKENKGFDKFKSSFLSGVNAAKDAAKEIAAKAKDERATTVRAAKAAVQDDIMKTISDLGLNDSRQTERDRNYEFFKQICGSALLMSIETFVKEMIKKGHSPQWADATFRAFDTQSSGFLSKFEFAVAMNVLKNNRALYDNPVWLKLRRRVAFAYYSRQGTNSIDQSAFNEFLDDLSISTEDPAMMGISNKLWRRNQAALKPAAALQPTLDAFADHSEDALRRALIEAKLELAQKEEENEMMHFQYLNMEKYACALKLQLAHEAEECDDDQS